jgi:hypothetical protein
MVHGSRLNEYFLYHGAPHDIIDSICRGGFDPRRGGTNAGKMFGVGSYFAENASKSDRYAEPNGDNEHCMVVARVCLGATHMTKDACWDFTMPPDRSDGNGPLDSVTAEKRTAGGQVDHREYMTYNKAQALPEYCIWYVHESTCQCVRCSP